MSNISFADDPFSRKVIRSLLLLQIAAMLIVVGLSFSDLFFVAFLVWILALFTFMIVVLWLYARYRELPVIREKRDLARIVHKFQNHIQAEELTIHAAIQKRAHLFQAEKDEVSTALKGLQHDYIQAGLAAASIQASDIPGIAGERMERLAAHNILSAADIGETIGNLPGFEGAKGQALLNWQSAVLEGLQSGKPSALPEEQLEAIRGKYAALHDANNAVDAKARSSKQMLEYELISFRPRLKQLAPFTFTCYMSRSLASRGAVAVPLALVLILTQVVSSVSATARAASSLIALMPTARPSPTAIIPPTETMVVPPRKTTTPSPTVIVSPTSTATATIMPSRTAQPLHTSTITQTSTPLPTWTALPSETAIIPVSGNCDPSYPGVCIPPAPPDLDCGDVSYRRFEVLPPDRHGFDRDGDGIGCES